VGFLGAGIIFVRGGSVCGLTTEAAIWVTAEIGSASGAGLPVLAVLTTGIYFVVVLAFPMAARRLPRSATAISALRVRYPDGRGILREVLREATARGSLSTMSRPRPPETSGHPPGSPWPLSGRW